MTFKDVPIGHIFRLRDCPICILRRVDEWAFNFVVRCEKHRGLGRDVDARAPSHGPGLDGRPVRPSGGDARGRGHGAALGFRVVRVLGFRARTGQ